MWGTSSKHVADFLESTCAVHACFMFNMHAQNFTIFWPSHMGCHIGDL